MHLTLSFHPFIKYPKKIIITNLINNVPIEITSLIFVLSIVRYKIKRRMKAIYKIIKTE